MFINSVYNSMFQEFLKMNNIKRATVKHQEVCPDCGKKLVNLYRKGNVFKCKKCWDKIK